MDESFKLFESAISDTSSPLYVLVWGNMKSFGKILSAHPEYSGNIRLITIGTGLMAGDDIQYIPSGREKSKPCEHLNWNGAGRDLSYNNPQFNHMWWIEINWTYMGMFTGNEPKEMLNKLERFGSMGQHIKEVVNNENWAKYFRVGDTPSVLYMIDPKHELDDPEKSSWAGKFTKPFPNERANYYTDFCGAQKWDYLNPCNTWENHRLVMAEAANTLTERRDERYHVLLEKLKQIYTK